MNIKLVGLAPLLIVLASQVSFGSPKSKLDLSESEIIDIINGKIDKVQKKQHKTIKQQKGNSAQRQLIKTQRYQPTQSKVVRPTYTAPVQRATPRPNLSSIPAWRRPASPTMTRSVSDALFAAAKGRNLNEIKKLLAEGADVNHQNFNGETALHIAASLGNLQMVRYLVSQGANVNARTGTLWLPIHHAMRFGHAGVANYLIAHKAQLKAKTIDGFSALDFAKKSKNPQIQVIATKY